MLQQSNNVIFTDKGIKITKQRNLLLDILKKLNEPQTAEQIFTRVEEINPGINLSTVYRVLELFVSKGLVIKSNRIDRNTAYFELSRENHTHQLVCLKCNKVIPIEKCPLKKLEESVKEASDFEITGHKLEVFGYCSDCRNSK